MANLEAIQRAVRSSRRLPRWVIGATLLVVAVVIGVTTRQVRAGIREQMIGRDAAVMQAVVTTQLEEQFGPAWEDADGGEALRAVLLASRLKGVIGTRLFDAEGRFVESFPVLVREAELPAERLAGLRDGQAASRFLGEVDPEEVFYAGNGNGNGHGREHLPLLVVEVPMRTTWDPELLGVAQFLIEGHSTAVEFARLDRQLVGQALALFAVAGVVLSGALSWAFGRLRRTQGLLADQSRHLERANQELARAARTAAVGAITAHLIHGLRSPLTGLQHYVASLGNGEGGNGAQEWETAVITTRRMQSLINEVVNVLREEEAASAYDVSVDELLGLVRGRAEGVAAERGVDLEFGGGVPVRLMNRTANLLQLVLVNLVDNAIQATPAGRRVRIEVDGDEKLLGFRVRDQGGGFPEAAVGNVFAPRRSTREGGAGIGLAISKQLADYLGATLELESSSSTGCVFALRLPVGYRQTEFVSSAGASGSEAGGRGGGWRGGWWLSWLLLGLVWARAAEEPPRWRWSNPTPHGNNIVDMAYSTELGVAVQVTERGQVYSSTDLSAWIPRESGTRKALRAVTFLGARLIITGEEGTVLFGDEIDAIRAGVLTDGPTQDWLEGCAASPDRVVAVGDNGAIYSSTDGSSWQRQSSGTSTWLRGVAYGGGRFVAVGEVGTILNSANGIDWVKVSSGTSADLNRVRYTGTQFVVVGDGGVVRVSASGSSWQNQSPNTSKDLLDVGVSGATRLVVGDGEVRRYENGTWSNEIGRVLGPPAWMYYSVMGRADGFLIAGQTGLMVEGQRLNGGSFSWEERSPSARNWLFDMVWVTNLYVAVGDRGTVMTSAEGVDWDVEVVPEGLASTVLLGVGGTTNLLVAAGSQGSLMISPNAVTNLVWTNDFGTVITQELSTLGLVWHAVEPRPVTNDLQGVTFHAGRHYLSGGAGTILSSADGSEWSVHQAPTTKFLSGIAGFPGGLVAVGDDGAMVFSAMGDDWVALPELTTNWLYRVRYLNGALLAVGQGGVIYASTNAVTWEPRVSGTTQWLNDVSWVDGHYYVAGTQGTVLRSSDGLVWTSLGTITAKSLYALATDGSRLFAAGFEGVIVRAPLVPDLTPIEILAYSRLDGPETGSHQNLFLFGGRVDQRFTLDYGTLGEDGGWTTGPLLEFLGRSGTFYYLETVSGGSSAPAEYYRGRMVP